MNKYISETRYLHSSKKIKPYVGIYESYYISSKKYFCILLIRKYIGKRARMYNMSRNFIMWINKTFYNDMGKYENS